MSEITFCRQFLTALDSRPIKLSSDHIADPRQYPAQNAFTLPKLPAPHPQRPNPPSSSTSPSTASGSTISITLKPMKPSQTTVPLSSVSPSTTSIFDLKSAYSTSTSIPAAKIKILYKKKPAADSKTVAEIIGQDAGQAVEFTVMVLGGAISTPVTSPPAVAPSEADKGLGSTSQVDVEMGGTDTVGSVAQGPSGKEVVGGEEFWSDLRGFVVQRLRDEKEGERLVDVFRRAWEVEDGVKGASGEKMGL